MLPVESFTLDFSLQRGSFPLRPYYLTTHSLKSFVWYKTVTLVHKLSRIIVPSRLLGWRGETCLMAPTSSFHLHMCVVQANAAQITIDVHLHNHYTIPSPPRIPVSCGLSLKRKHHHRGTPPHRALEGRCTKTSKETKRK